MVGQLPPAITEPTGTEETIVYVNGVPKTMTSLQIAETASATTQYGLQLAIWFNSTPQTSELLALYVSPVAYQYPANFSLSYSAPPIVNPTAEFVMNVDHQSGGVGEWITFGTISVATDGTVTFATVGGLIVTVAAGDRIRVLGPVTADSTISGFAATLKGEPST